MPDTPYFRHRLQNQVSVTELVTIHYFEYGREYVYPGERHDFWEIMYMDRGSVRVTCGEQEHLLSRGELILLPPNVFHALHTIEGTPSNMFIVSFSEESGALAPLGGQVLRLTAAMGYGKTYLSNVFQRVYGRSIMDCYTQLKLNEAKYLLRQGSMTVSQISDRLCFSSPQYFSKRFSQVMHMSPRQYASSVREDWTTTVE